MPEYSGKGVHQIMANALEELDIKLLGERLTIVRRAAGLSLGQTVKLSGFTRAELGEWECGVSRPTPKQFLDLVEIYGCEISDVLCDPIEFPSEKEAIDAYNRGEIGDNSLARYLRVGIVFARFKAQAEQAKTCEHQWMHDGPNSRICIHCNHYEWNL